ncbi:MAG: type I methionyl aminopeptidase [Propionibacterium sp.]|nr:type I methionyl aminopeptidase [Propionibacterium sp.]
MSFVERIELKRPDQISVMRRAGLVVAEALLAMRDAVSPGATTSDLDEIARRVLIAHGATSSFLNYGVDWGFTPYPAVTCVSVNDEIVHGIPGSRELLQGDVVSVDFGAIVDGWHGDAARTFVVGEPSGADAALIETTRRAMWDGIAAAHGGKRVGDVSAAIERSIVTRGQAEGRSYGIVRDFTGHGIGTSMHMAPDVPNYGRSGRGPRLSRGMCLAIEPMLTLGTEQTVTLDDDWTVVTADAARAAHWENTIAITDRGIWVLTEPDGGRAELEALGVPFGGPDA